MLAAQRVLVFVLVFVVGEFGLQSLVLQCDLAHLLLHLGGEADRALSILWGDDLRGVLHVFLACVAASDALLVVKFLLSQGQLVLRASDLLDELALVVGVFGNDLAAEVLDLLRHFGLLSLNLLTHDVAPDHVQLGQNLAHSSLVQHTFVLLLDSGESLNRLGWDPVVVHLCTG